MIPKILHLCWLSGDAYPAKISKCIDSWKRVLPDYEIMLWDTHRFDLNKSQWVREAFEKKKYAFAADYIRFYALYHHGGKKAGTPEAAILGAEKGCDWIKQCLDYYEGRSFIKADGSLDIRKLPEIMVEQIEKIKPIRNLSLEDSENIRKFDLHKEVIVLNDAYFSPKVFDSREVELTPYTYAIHHYQNSWFSPKAKVYYRTRTFLIRIFGYQLVRKAECLLMPWKFKNG